MPRLRRLLSHAFALVALAACQDAAGPGNAPVRITSLPRQLSTDEQQVIATSNGFAFDLLREVNRDRADSNVFLSPLSVAMSLGMTMNGAAGETFDEMRSALGFGAATHEETLRAYKSLIELLRNLDPQVQFELANAIWTRQEFAPFVEPAFLDEARNYFDAEVGMLDFAAPAAVTTINDWARTHTNGKIDHVIDGIDDWIVMLLANAIYFKGDWRERFDKAHTRPESFALRSGTTTTVPTMQRDGALRRAGVPQGTVIDLSYGGDAWSMTILLPDPGVDVNAFIAGLTPDTWNAATTSLNDWSGDLHMPKFKLAWSGRLNEPLKSLGMRRAFVPYGADFTRISHTMGDQLYIDFVKHDTYVDVNEEGTEAAAATTTGVGIVCACGVHIDRPFVFAIRERLSGTILFVGKIVNPGL